PIARQSHPETTGFYGGRRDERSAGIPCTGGGFAQPCGFVILAVRVCKTQYTGSTPVGASRSEAPETGLFYASTSLVPAETRSSALIWAGLRESVEGRVEREDERGSGLRVEVEVVGEVAEDGCVLTDVWAGIGASVCLRVDARATEEVVFDELEVGVLAEDLVV